MNPDHFGFTNKELRKLRSLRDPYGIQRFLDDMSYHLEDSAWSPRKVLAEGSSHCLEGAIFGAAALRVNGYPPLLLDFEHALVSDRLSTGVTDAQRRHDQRDNRHDERRNDHEQNASGSNATTTRIQWVSK